MKKFLIFIITIFMFTGLARADVKISGFMQHIIGMGDDVDGGVTDMFSRFAMSADTTLDNGWTAGGSFALSVQSLLSASTDAYLPTSNSFYIHKLHPSKDNNSLLTNFLYYPYLKLFLLFQ